MYNGVRIIYDPLILADTEVRTFPISRHRSARIRKKLIKRYGGEFKREPAIFHDQVRNVFYAHPSFKAEIEAKVPQARPNPVDCRFGLNMI